MLPIRLGYGRQDSLAAALAFRLSAEDKGICFMPALPRRLSLISRHEPNDWTGARGLLTLLIHSLDYLVTCDSRELTF